MWSRPAHAGLDHGPSQQTKQTFSDDGHSATVFMRAPAMFPSLSHRRPRMVVAHSGATSVLNTKRPECPRAVLDWRALRNLTVLFVILSIIVDAIIIAFDGLLTKFGGTLLDLEGAVVVYA